MNTRALAVVVPTGGCFATATGAVSPARARATVELSTAVVVQIFDGINASGVDVAEVSPQSRSSVVAVEEPAMKVRDYLLGLCTSTAGRNQSLTQRHNLFASSNYALVSAGSDTPFVLHTTPGPNRFNGRWLTSPIVICAPCESPAR